MYVIIETIKREIKEAMINKDEIKKNTLKQVLNKANAEAKEISLKKKTEIEMELTDTVCINAINKEIKQIDQTLSLLENKKDCDLYKNSIASKEILKAYLPKQLSEDEIESEIRKLLSNIDVNNKGLVMKTVMGELKGKADGKVINSIVNKVLNELLNK